MNAFTFGDDTSPAAPAPNYTTVLALLTTGAVLTGIKAKNSKSVDGFLWTLATVVLGMGALEAYVKYQGEQ